MGRGRAKAKQTKVARDLKYRTWETDLSELERELKHKADSNGSDQSRDDDQNDPDGQESR